MVLWCTKLFGFLALSQNLEKTIDPIPRKHPDTGKDGENAFCRAHPGTNAGTINIANKRLSE